MTVNDIVKKAQDEMNKAVEFLKQEFRSVRTGRATPALVDTLRIDVESYDSSMSLKELANIAVTEGNVIIIKPFDPSTLKDIQRGIEKSGLGINPQNDGKMIRLPVPPLSGERRNQLTNHIKQLAEQQKVAVRTSRRDANKSFDAAKKAKTLSEDDAERGEEQVQKITDEFIKKIDKMTEEKAKEIMEV
ncbi:MAG TPA: ribosome recycling factor [Phycisphaerae bacterium]|jgi:ribosome recycling factor|nr:ribosome recycling factor [Phycisphaerae bacterium]